LSARLFLGRRPVVPEDQLKPRKPVHRAGRDDILKKCILLILLCSCSISSSVAQAEHRVQYATPTKDFAQVYPGGPAPLLVMHEAGWSYAETENISARIAAEGVFTVFNLEWQDKDRQPWGSDVGQIKQAVAYVQAHAGGLGVVATRLAMLGGSRGANLALLTSMELNAAVPRTVKAVVALSGDADPAETINRAQRGETPERTAGKLSNVYGCEPILVSCPTAYIDQWSPTMKAASSAPATFLAASESEAMTANLEDERELATKLSGLGVASEVFAPESGHGFGYWRGARPSALAFLAREDGE
jgi:acetyl esterase/lipase